MDGATDSGGYAYISGIPAGTYTLKFTKTGYMDWNKQVTIDASKTTEIHAYLQYGIGVGITRSETISASTAQGYLRVYSNVDGANIYIGVEVDGATDSGGYAYVSGIPAGTYILRLSRAGYVDWAIQVTIDAGETTEVHANLVK
jgi:hypothetical protein